MSSREPATPIAAPPARGLGALAFSGVLLVTLIYAAGLVQRIEQPWSGMHDWNGAFFSQLARNLLRYPWEIHHGLPLVAVGESVPPPDERSLYLTHPPGLVWLVAASFRFFGEGEWAARLIPILASAGTIALMIGLVRDGRGPRAGYATGVIYALTPMAVYFGRMVDHEAICLFSMVAALAAWQGLRREAPLGRPRVRGAGMRRSGLWLALAASIGLGVWTDWPVVLFAGLLCAYSVYAAMLRRLGGWQCLGTCLISTAAVAGMLWYLVHFGLNDRWQDLEQIFLSRSSHAAGEAVRADLSAQGDPWTLTVDNLAWPGVIFGILGAALLLTGRLPKADPPPATTNAEANWRMSAGSMSPMVLLTLTGAIWLAVFWRQYERHNYWLFYLGPSAAWLAAEALLAVSESLATFTPLRTRTIASAGLLVFAGFGLVKTNDYFTRESYRPAEVIEAWRRLSAITQPTDRVVLYVDPVVEERRGGYTFRNIVPPQQAYYLDRRFTVCTDLTRVPKLAEDHALFILRTSDAGPMEGTPHMLALRRRYKVDYPPALVVFDLRSEAMLGS